MKQRLKKLRIRKIICICVALIACAILLRMIFNANTVKNPTPMLPFLVLLSIAMMVFSRTHNESKALRVGDKVLDYLNTRFENAQYMPTGGIGEQEVRAAGIIEGSWNRYGSTDMISGSYKGMDFEQSRIILAKGNVNRNTPSESVAFMGRWICFMHGEKTPCKVIIRKNQGGKAHKKGAEFGDKFSLYFAKPRMSERDISARIKHIALKADEIFTGGFTMCLDGAGILVAANEDFSAPGPEGVSGAAKKEMLDPLKSVEKDVDDIVKFIDILCTEK